jgi:hypothetical protein
MMKSSKYNVKTLTHLLSAICLMFSVGVHAANQNYTASVTGSDGSSGTVSFTVDSALATAGASIMASPGCGAAAPVLKAFSLTMTGGTTGGSQTWNCSHVAAFFCGNPAGAATPCTTMLTFNLNTNGSATLLPTSPTTATVTWGAGAGVTFGVPVVAAAPVAAPIDFGFSKQSTSFAKEIEVK